MKRAVPLVVAVASVAVVVVASSARADVVRAEPGDPVGRLARPGVTVELAPGVHLGFTVAEAATVRGLPGSVVRGDVIVEADRARLTDLVVEGSRDGIWVERADHVVLERVTIRSSDEHGIHINAGSATITDCVVGGLGELGQGIEVRNANGHPRTIIEGCHVTGGMEGIVTHVSRAEVRDNVVEGTLERGISITEMSEGVVERNVVRDATGLGLWCGDMSHCEFRNNEIRNIADDGSGVRFMAGYGAVAFYYSTMRVRDNIFDVEAAEPVGVFTGSILTDRFPPSVWPDGWRGALPGLGVSALSLAGLFLLALALRPLAPRLVGRAATEPSRAAMIGWLGAFAIQTGHMIEHGVQVFQTYVAEGPNRSGLLGAHADGEWLHLAFNASVVVFLVWTWVLGRGLLQGAPFAASILAAAVLVQGYHLAEHVVKVVQHVAHGFNPAPGLFGADFGLVWFHYGINLAVYAGAAVPLGVIAVRLWHARRARGSAGSAALLESPPTLA